MLVDANVLFFLFSSPGGGSYPARLLAPGLYIAELKSGFTSWKVPTNQPVGLLPEPLPVSCSPVRPSSAVPGKLLLKRRPPALTPLNNATLVIILAY